MNDYLMNRISSILACAHLLTLSIIFGAALPCAGLYSLEKTSLASYMPDILLLEEKEKFLRYAWLIFRVSKGDILGRLSSARKAYS